MEKDREANNNLLYKLSQQVPGVLYQYRYHPDGRNYFPYASSKIWEVYEVNPEDVKDDASLVLSRIHPDDYEEVLQTITHSFESLEVWNREYRVLLPQQGLRCLHGEAQPEKLSDGSVLWHGYIQDITEKRQAEKALTDNRMRWQFALEGANDGVWDWNLISNEVYFSPRWKAMLGFEDHEIKGSLEEWVKSVHPDDLETCYADIQKHLDRKVPIYSNTHRVLCKDGSFKWILDRGKVVEYNEKGEALRMVGTHTDLTEKMETEHKLIQLNAEKDKFFSIIAHDLKGPFNALLGFTELLQDKDLESSPEERLDMVEIVHRSAEKAYKLLDNLLTWSRSQTGGMSFSPTPLELQKLVADELALLEDQATNKGLALKNLVPKDHVVFADLNMAGTILRNLLSNAIKFTKSGGTISVSSQVNEAHKTLEVSVRDTGIGIPEAKIPDLFQLDKSTSTPGINNEMGTGLGLILCKDFVEKHGGEISVESEVGKGSVFRFSLPLKEKTKA